MKDNLLIALAVILLFLSVHMIFRARREGFAHPIITEALRPYSSWNPYSGDFNNYLYRAPLRYGWVNTWNGRRRGGGRYYSGKPFRYWTRYLAPSYYPTGGYYGYDLKEWYDPYDYTNDPLGDICYARIDISDAFGPYAGVAGKQQWLDFGSRNGFQKVYLARDSVTNDHAIVEYVGRCNRAASEPPSKDRYQMHRPIPQFY